MWSKVFSGRQSCRTNVGRVNVLDYCQRQPTSDPTCWNKRNSSVLVKTGMSAGHQRLSTRISVAPPCTMTIVRQWVIIFCYPILLVSGALLRDVESATAYISNVSYHTTGVVSGRSGRNDIERQIQGSSLTTSIHNLKTWPRLKK